MGYMGLYCIFMLLKEESNGVDDFDDIGCIESFSLKDMPEMLWGDRIGRYDKKGMNKTLLSSSSPSILLIWQHHSFILLLS